VNALLATRLLGALLAANLVRFFRGASRDSPARPLRILLVWIAVAYVADAALAVPVLRLPEWAAMAPSLFGLIGLAWLNLYLYRRVRRMRRERRP
jgi:membrane associated rhomboid family serine protease